MAQNSLPTTPAEAKEVLRVFNVKFDKMISYSFYQHPSFEFNLRTDNRSMQTTVTVDVPTDEQIDAVLLHLRFFFATNEATAHKHIKKSYDLLTTLPIDLAGKFQIAYDNWTNWLAAPSRIGGYTNERFFSIMVYGERIHRNTKATCDVYDEWMRDLLLRDYAIVELCRAIDDITALAGKIYVVNREALTLP